MAFLQNVYFFIIIILYFLGIGAIFFIDIESITNIEYIDYRKHLFSIFSIDCRGYIDFHRSFASLKIIMKIALNLRTIPG